MFIYFYYSYFIINIKKAMSDDRSFVLTGAANGIGKGVAVECCMNRHFSHCTLIDKDLHALGILKNELVSMIGEDAIQTCGIDVTETFKQKTCFAKHVSTFGTLDAVILNAGIGETDDFILGDGWQECLRVNLIAVMEGVRLGVQSMLRARKFSEKPVQTILVVASAGGIWPMNFSPVYSAAKAGCVMLVRSLAPMLWKKYHIRICCVCPQFVDTELGRRGAGFQSQVTSMLSVSEVSSAIGDMLENDAEIRPGDVVALMSQGGHLVRRVLNTVKTEKIYSIDYPSQGRKIIIDTLSHDFKEASHVVSCPIPTEDMLKPGHVLVKNIYCGVNASDINYSAGRYHGGKPPLPMDAGFEATGIVVATSVEHMPVGTRVAYLHYGGFSEYLEIHNKFCLRVFDTCPQVVALLTSGLTASIALEQMASIQPGDSVLITAAAGGTGQFFVQLAKRAGAHVIATCGSDEKAALLAKLGADTIINYKRDRLEDVLGKKSVSIAIELVGGDLFETALKSLKIGGRLIIIGAMSQYSSGWKPSVVKGLPERLLANNQSLVGFFLLHYAKHFQRHFDMLQALYREGKLTVALDPTRFQGIESIYNAIDLLHSGNSRGKVTVKLDSSSSSSFSGITTKSKL